MPLCHMKCVVPIGSLHMNCFSAPDTGDWGNRGVVGLVHRLMAFCSRPAELFAPLSPPFPIEDDRHLDGWICRKERGGGAVAKSS